MTDELATVAAGAVREAERVLAAVQQERLALDCGRLLAARLARVELPEPVKTRVARLHAFEPARWENVDAYERSLDDTLALEVDSLAQLRHLFLTEVPSGLAETGRRRLVTGMGGPYVDVSPVDRQWVVAQVAMDRLLGVTETDDDPDLQNARRFGVLPGLPHWKRLREAYVQVTGDWAVTGIVNPEGSLVREANEVNSAVLNHVLLNSMTKRLVQDFRAQPNDWRKFCTVQNVPNFKNQERIKLHDFSSLSIVPEGANYTTLPWDDARESYAPFKHGNLVVVTREVVMNDDLQAVQRIPSKLAVAAATTINEFVFGLFTANPTMMDGKKVFDDGVQTAHANRGTAALSSAALQAAIATVMKQTSTAAKRLHLRPRFILVPADLLFPALTLVSSTLVPGSANNDANVLKGAVEVIPVAQFTDPTDWYLVCHPSHVESIEVGFVGGRETPELLIQDRPLNGQVFTNDQMSFKIRWEFGGAWIDYRGAYWSQVAG